MGSRAGRVRLVTLQQHARMRSTEAAPSEIDHLLKGCRVTTHRLSGEGGPPWGCNVFMFQSAYETVWEHLRQETTREHGGLLFGYVDPGDDTRVLITKAVPAEHTEGTAIQLTMGIATWERFNEIEDDLKRKEPTLRRVGWYHSHPSMAIFLSPQDLDVCSVFKSPSALALVVDPVQDRGGMFVRGGRGFGAHRKQGIHEVHDLSDESIVTWRDAGRVDPKSPPANPGPVSRGVVVSRQAPRGRDALEPEDAREPTAVRLSRGKDQVRRKVDAEEEMWRVLQPTAARPPAKEPASDLGGFEKDAFRARWGSTRHEWTNRGILQTVVWSGLAAAVLMTGIFSAWKTSELEQRIDQLESKSSLLLRGVFPPPTQTAQAASLPPVAIPPAATIAPMSTAGVAPTTADTTAPIATVISVAAPAPTGGPHASASAAPSASVSAKPAAKPPVGGKKAWKGGSRKGETGGPAKAPAMGTSGGTSPTANETASSPISSAEKKSDPSAAALTPTPASSQMDSR